MRRIQTDVHIEAAPAQVWQVLVDFATYPAWSPHLTVAGRPERGQRLRVTAAAPGAQGMRFTPWVLAAEPGRVLRWRGRLLVLLLCDGVHEFVLSPQGAGTRLLHAEDFTGLLVPFLNGALEQTERRMQEQNQALKRHAERSVIPA